MNAELLAAIGAALGRDEPYEVSPPPRDGGMFVGRTMQPVAAGGGNRVIAGTVDRENGLVGWVEETVEPPRDGYLPVDITINRAWPGRGGSRSGRRSRPTTRTSGVTSIGCASPAAR